MESQLTLQSPFKPFGAEHLIVIGLTVCLSAVLSVLVYRSRSQRIKQRIVCFTIAFLLLGAEWFNYAYVLIHYGGAYFLKHSLPLHVCGFALYLTAYVLITKNQLIFQMVYFWAFAGTIQALLTPVTQEGFPSWDCFHFFLTHGGVIVGASVATFGLGMRPTLKGLWMTYGMSWALVFVVGGFDYLLGANYMYLCKPPSGNTPFYFLPWPWYILFLGLLAIILFLILWLPFSRSRREK